MTTLWRTTLALVAGIFCLASLPTLASASSLDASPLPGSAFTAADGDQEAAGGLTDWQTYANEVTSKIDAPVPEPTGPDYYYKGQEDSPDTWTLDSTDGGISPAKSNALAAFSLRDPLLGDQFFYFAFDRQSPSGANAFLGFELNKRTSMWVNSVGTTIPCRSTGDVLISYEIDPSNKSVIFTAYKWTGAGGPATCPEGKTGSFSPVSLGLGNTQGYMNFDNAITNYLATATSNPSGPLPASFAAGTFGEGAINLSNTIGAGADPCFSFGQVQLHSRSSASLSSALQDTVDPAPIVLRQCTASGTKYEDKNANGVQDAGEPGLAGWRIYVDTDGDGAYDAGEPAAVTADGSTPGQPLGSYTINNIPSGTDLHVHEAPPAGETATWYCGPQPGPTGTLSSDCHYTETFTANSNHTGLDFGNYRMPTIEVVKNLAPDDDAGRFDLSIDGKTMKANAGDGDTTGPQPVQLGIAHGVAEAGGTVPPTTLTDYTPTYSCTVNGTPSFAGGGTSSIVTPVLFSGDAVKCVFTNTRKTGKLRVVKQVVSTDPGEAGLFNLQIDGLTEASDVGDGGSTGFEVVNTGLHTVGETAGTATTLDDYTSATVCRDGQDTVVPQNPAGTVEVTFASEITCTITNTRKTGTLTVVKRVVPAADPGLFDLEVDGKAVKDDASDGGSADVVLTSGTHTVGESAGSVGDLADYTSAIACDDDKPAAGIGPVEVIVTSGAHIRCTITNTRKATVTIHKVTAPADPTKTGFAFASGLPPAQGIAADGSFSLADGHEVGVQVAPGSYPVSEHDPKPLGSKLTGLVCTEDKVANSAVPTGADIATQREATIVADPGEHVDCTFTNTKVVGEAVVVKAGDTFAYHGDTVTYSFAVTNVGNSPLHDVHVTDDKCPNVSAEPTSEQNDDGDGLLEMVGTDGTGPEVWVYTCSYVIGDHAGGEANPVVNTATVEGTDEYDRPVAASDQHATTILHPALSLSKTGAATATAGGRIDFTLQVTNTGDVAFGAAQVIVTDALCEAPPQLGSANGDSTPGTLDPGDHWTYGCTVQTMVGQMTVHNVATVNGTDVNGRPAGATATADSALTQPVRKVLGASTGTAKLRGPVGCAKATSRVVVTGSRIRSVVFYVDGRKVRTLTKADKQRRWIHTVRTTKLKYGTHRVKVRVTFTKASATKARTLTMVINRCRPTVKPKFTG